MSSARSLKTAWLSSKLKQFALDEEIYLNYIESVLDGEEDQCEKVSALEEILGEVLVSVLRRRPPAFDRNRYKRVFRFIPA